MEIKSLHSNNYLPKQNVGKEVSKHEEASSKQSDSIEISAKAQKLSKTVDNGKNLDAIRTTMRETSQTSAAALAEALRKAL